MYCTTKAAHCSLLNVNLEAQVEKQFKSSPKRCISKLRKSDIHGQYKKTDQSYILTLLALPLPLLHLTSA